MASIQYFSHIKQALSMTRNTQQAGKKFLALKNKNIKRQQTSFKKVRSWDLGHEPAGWSKLVFPHNMICIEQKHKKEMDSGMGQDWVGPGPSLPIIMFRYKRLGKPHQIYQPRT